MRQFSHLLTVIASLYCGLTLAASVEEPSKISPVRLRIDTARVSPLVGELHGFNTNLMRGEYGYGDAEFKRQTAGLRPSMLRFPGGTIANFYHWREGGFDQAELASSTSERLNRRNLKNYALLQQRRQGKIAFDAFMALCGELGARPVLVANLYTGTPAESAAWVRHVKDNGYAVAGWELGNEMYLPFYRNRFPSVDAYIETAKRHAQAMRAVDPGIRLAVPVHAAGFHLYSSSNYAQQWNNRLAAERFYDAYVVHMYLHLDKFFGKGYGDDLDALRANLFGLSEASVRKALAAYRALFGEREMWVTEWNLMGGEKKQIADTLLHALYVADFSVQLLAADSPIAKAGYHVLAGPWNGFPTFSPKWSSGSTQWGSVQRASYRVFELLGKVYGQATERYALRVENASELHGTHPDVKADVAAVTAAAVGKDGRLMIPVINRGAESRSIQLLVDGHAPAKPVHYRHLAAPRLSERGADGGLAIGDTVTDAARLSLPGNSFGVIELQ